ncbi:hypothetical protein C4559_06385 [Candidatus Microgenomates bacterium]|nr:MAG: hypothetical protein C4559_06385 [Candidatus Microgenomates bacterium]
MDNKIALSSLALDLKRIALAYHRGSEKVAQRFFKEAIKRKEEIDVLKIKPYIVKLLEKFENIKIEKDHQKRAEDALMYSFLFQNAALKQ